jgi:hypothetical protein
MAGPCPAEPFQLVPAHLGLSPAGSYQLWYTNLRIATEARPTRNISDNLIQDSGFHGFVTISVYTRPTTGEIQKMSNYLCITMEEYGFLYEGYYVSLPGMVLDRTEEAEEAEGAAEVPASAWAVSDLE